MGIKLYRWDVLYRQARARLKKKPHGKCTREADPGSVSGRSYDAPSGHIPSGFRADGDDSPQTRSGRLPTQRKQGMKKPTPDGVGFEETEG
jgi:hypothetical protein